MPANLTHKYLKAEAEYRRARTPDEELHCLQVMLRELPKHKGTDKLQADLKQKISRAKKERLQAKSSGIRIPRQGAGRVVLIGSPNAGKSQLVRSLTRATPEVAPYPFTTREPLPAMMPYEDVLIQLIDTPPITAELFDPTTQGLIRDTDLVLLVVDLGSDDGIDGLQQVLDRLASTKTRLGMNTCLDPHDVGVAYTATLVVFNKSDDPEAADRRELLESCCPLEYPAFEISALQSLGLEPLREAIFRKLDIVRVYTKLPNSKTPDYDRPFTIRKGGTLLDIAERIHKDVARGLKQARVWGSQVHDGTLVKADYVLHDKDIVEIHQ